MIALGLAYDLGDLGVAEASTNLSATTCCCSSSVRKRIPILSWCEWEQPLERTGERLAAIQRSSSLSTPSRSSNAGSGRRPGCGDAVQPPLQARIPASIAPQRLEHSHEDVAGEILRQRAVAGAVVDEAS
ncbi:MAG: hypothetical protein U0470_06435 [Anaerolineae bacterium]